MTDSHNTRHEPEEVESLIAPEDIRSTSRSCLAIILVMVAIVLMLCVFLVVQTWVN